MAKLKKDPSAVNFGSVFNTLVWDKEVSPVDLVKAVNSVECCKTSKEKYHVGEVYFNPLRSAWERWLKTNHPEVKVYTSGKDVFYKMMKKVSTVVVEPEYKKKEYYIPTSEVVKEEKKEKKTFPDRECVNKAVCILSLIEMDKATNDNVQVWKDEYEWKTQRYVRGHGVCTIPQELNIFLKEMYGLENCITLNRVGKHTKLNYSGEKTIKDIISDCKSLDDVEEKIAKLLSAPKKEKREETFEDIWKRSFMLRYLRSLSIVREVKSLEDVDIVTLQKDISNLYKVDLTDEEILEFLEELENISISNLDKLYFERYSLKNELKSFTVRVKRTREVLRKEYPNLMFRTVEQLGPKDSIFEVTVDLGNLNGSESEAAHLVDRLIFEDDEYILGEKSSRWLVERISYLAGIRYF